MAYAILRFAKHKGGASKALSAHHERTKEFYASNPDIDKSRTVQNEHLIAPYLAALSFGDAPLELRAGDPAPPPNGGVPRAKRQRKICGHAGDGQPRICEGA